MAKQYWVGDFFVDPTRNQITLKKEPQKIPPKALAVLTCLAQNANKVVSQEQILSEVWPDTVVSPNTLQRSIAQLRKALDVNAQNDEQEEKGDNRQPYIKTHAKQGYSLEVEVKWQAEVEKVESEHAKFEKVELEQVESEQAAAVDIISSNTLADSDHESEADSEINSEPSKSPLEPSVILAAIVCAVIFVVIGFYVLAPAPSIKLNIAEFNSLTASDNKEYSGIYSPDGQYVVFQRYSEVLCRNNNIWAKNIKTQQEFQLTKNMGAYGSHSFSPDGKSLVFIESDNCDRPITQKRCYKLMTMDFDNALNAPQSPKVLVECKNSRIVRPIWLNNQNILLAQEFSNRMKLTSYSITQNKSEVIYAVEEGNIVHFDYSTVHDLIALTRLHSDGQLYIEMLESDGQVLSSHQIELPDEVPANRFIYPNFTPYPSQLMFSTGKQLFTLSYEGKVTNISLPLNKPIGSPKFHPDGKRMLVIKGFYDSDIVTLPRTHIEQHQGNSNYTILERSTQQEDYAKFQPNGELIAYKSYRTGKYQLWITDGKNPRQVSDFPIDTFLNELYWAADGKSILVNANKQLTRLLIDDGSDTADSISKTEAKTIAFEHPVETLFQWDSERNTALLNARIKGVLMLVEFDLTTGSYEIVNDKKVNWAFKSDDGRLIYMDAMDELWQSGAVEDEPIAALAGQGSDNGLIIKDNIVYGVNENFQLWSYGLDDNSFTMIGKVPDKTDYITDINQTDILLTLRIAAKKEVAEIVLVE